VSEANVELLRRGYEDFRTRGIEAVIEHLDPDVEVKPIDEAPGSQTYHGHAGFRRYLESIADVFGEFGWDAGEMVDVGSHVMVETLFHAQGRSSGIPVRATVYFVWSFRDGKVVRVRGYMDRAAAMAACA
jgi:ketosteroid isomerase-like protein